jgi:hypothetical protein
MFKLQSHPGEGFLNIHPGFRESRDPFLPPLISAKGVWVGASHQNPKERLQEG